MLNAIELNNIEKQYGKSNILDQISFVVKKGEFVGLVGVNGAGKTTLIKSILDLTDINGGSIKLFDKEHVNTSARINHAYLPERFNPPSYLKGDEFVHYMLELHQVKYEKNDVNDVLKKLDFDVDKLPKYVQTYSKGMIQKLGLASAFLSNKPLLILDEPMSGLDPKARKYLKEYFTLLKQKQTTLFISTHLLTDVASICDKLLVLNNGNIVFEGRPSAFLQEHETNDYDEAFVTCISK